MSASCSLDINTHYPYPGGFIDVWAWKTEPGKPITAGQIPEHATALLAAVALPLALRRRRGLCSAQGASTGRRHGQRPK